ncbi:HU family DNA-binding protein [Bacillus sp. NP157]|nr:HU family DNA-binding protein [Bacillus sp. NP157]
MNKSELVAAIAEKANLKKIEAENALNAFIEAVGESLAKGEKIAIVGFGSFEVRSRAARTGRNPRTNEEIKIAASNVPAFKAGNDLKKAVN